MIEQKQQDGAKRGISFLRGNNFLTLNHYKNDKLQQLNNGGNIIQQTIQSSRSEKNEDFFSKKVTF